MDDYLQQVDHDYDVAAFSDATEVFEVDEKTSKSDKINIEHTPIKSPNPKKKKQLHTEHPEGRNDQSTSAAILLAVQTLTNKVDGQTAILISIQQRIGENATAIESNKKQISELQKDVIDLRRANKKLKEDLAEHARYKRRWNLRLVGLKEEEQEDTREVVIGILTRIVPVSVDQLRASVDTVHRLGTKPTAATANGSTRAIILQFGMRTVRDEVWRRSKDARVCSEMDIRFKEDFSKEDREARAELWPLVKEARRKGKKAFLKDGYAIIDNKRVDPPDGTAEDG